MTLKTELDFYTEKILRTRARRKILEASETANAIGRRAFEGDSAEVTEMQRAGVSTTSVALLATQLGLTKRQLRSLLRLPSTKTRLRTAGNETLSSAAAGRLWRLDRILRRAYEVFEDLQAASTWLKQSNRSLRYEAPLTLIDTQPGYETVMYLLAQIELGHCC
jgi:putative toxin-antitoxin system antitoxin component (TIGR02293 family)